MGAAKGVVSGIHDDCLVRNNLHFFRTSCLSKRPMHRIGRLYFRAGEAARGCRY